MTNSKLTFSEKIQLAEIILDETRHLKLNLEPIVWNKLYDLRILLRKLDHEFIYFDFQIFDLQINLEEDKLECPKYYSRMDLSIDHNISLAIDYNGNSFEYDSNEYKLDTYGLSHERLMLLNESLDKKIDDIIAGLQSKRNQTDYLINVTRGNII